MSKTSLCHHHQKRGSPRRQGGRRDVHRLLHRSRREEMPRRQSRGFLRRMSGTLTRIGVDSHVHLDQEEETPPHATLADLSKEIQLTRSVGRQKCLRREKSMVESEGNQAPTAPSDPQLRPKIPNMSLERQDLSDRTCTVRGRRLRARVRRILNVVDLNVHSRRKVILDQPDPLTRIESQHLHQRIPTSISNLDRDT